MSCRAPLGTVPYRSRALWSARTASRPGGLLLFVEDGRLSGLEVYSLTDDSLPMPDLEHVRWYPAVQSAE
jgi:hypothetical protein